MKAESLVSTLVWMKNGVGCHVGSGKGKEGLICITKEEEITRKR